MRPFPIFVAVFFCACTAPDKREKTPERTAGTIAQAGSDSVTPATVPAFSDPASSPGPGPSRDGEDGVAELRRLAATRQKILVDRLDVDSVSAGELVPHEATTPSAHGGEYHFGDSEWESTLTLSVQGNEVTGVLGYADWENETWVGKRVRFDGGKIIGASFSAPGWKGVFVRYQGRPGIVILRAATDRLSVQYGEKL